MSLLLIADYDEISSDGSVQTKSTSLLFDGGPDENLWRQNVSKLKIDLSSIDCAVLSHYHTDHSNGLRAAVKDIQEARNNNRIEGIECPLIVDLHDSKIVSRGIKVRGLRLNFSHCRIIKQIFKIFGHFLDIFII